LDPEGLGGVGLTHAIRDDLTLPLKKGRGKMQNNSTIHLMVDDQTILTWGSEVLSVLIKQAAPLSLQRSVISIFFDIISY
jgi:hypothetical protein